MDHIDISTIFYVWYGIGFIFSLFMMVNAWYDGEDIFVPSIFGASLIGPFMVIPVLVAFHDRFNGIFTIKGRKK